MKLCSLVLLAACTSEVSTDQITEQSATERYYLIHVDARKCPWPTCGGYFLTEPVFGKTTYVPELDWRAPGADRIIYAASMPGDRALVRGIIAENRLAVTEAWLEENDTAPQGTFVEVVNNGIVCIKAPCPTMTETVLNTPFTMMIGDLYWEPSGLSDREILSFEEQLDTGIIVAGWRVLACRGGTCAKGRAVTAAYHRCD